MQLKSYVCKFLLYLYLFSAFFLQAQEKYQLKTFTTDNGLPHDFIQSIVQDQLGFIWIATWDGLSRFDGYEFKNYYHKPGDTTSLPFFSTDKVLVDKQNQVWLFCQGRPVVFLNRAKDCFTPFQKTPFQLSHLSDIALGPDQNMWLTDGEFLYKLNVDDFLISKFSIKKDTNQLTDNEGSVPQIAFDNKAGIWIYCWHNNEYQVYKCKFVERSNVKLQDYGKIAHREFKSSEVHNNTGNFEFYISGSGKIWLFTKYGLFYFDANKNCFAKNIEKIDPSEFKGKPLFAWAEEKTGVWIIDTKSQTLQNLGTKNSNYIETVFVDRTRKIWSGDINPTQENIGLNRYQKVPHHFRHYLTGLNENKHPNVVFPILKDSYNNLWVGTRYLNYLFCIKQDGTEEKIDFQAISKTSDKQRARGLVLDSNGIWIGTSGDLLIYYNLKSRKTTVRYPYKKEIKPGPVGCHNLLKTNNDLIINGVKGIYRYNPETDISNLGYKHEPIGTGFTLVKDNNGGYWLGSYTNRVIHLNAELKQLADYKIGPENTIAEHICIGDHNDIWIAFMGGGLGHLFPETGKYEIFTTSDGLSNNVLYSILKDRRGNLWIATNQGISRFNPSTRQFRNYGKEDGLLVTDFNSDSYFQSPDGEMFFGGMGGLVSFYPDSVDGQKDAATLSKLVITDFKVSGIPRYFKNAVYESDTLTLKKGDDNFQITFAYTAPDCPEKIKYRYRLEGSNSQWTETNYRNRNVSYASLLPGNYRFEIEATDKNEEWTIKNAYRIIIPFKYYQTVWFKILVIINLLLVVAIFAGMLLRQFRLRGKQLQNELKLESLRGQLNPHFIFNSLNSINYFISNNNQKLANSYIADFSRLIRNFLNNLTKDYISFEKELQSIQDYLRLEHLRFGDKFDYLIDEGNLLDEYQLFVFPGMVQPFIENAIWHGVRLLEDRKGIIKVSFQKVYGNSLKCVIEDDGVGRKLSERFRSDLPWKKSHGLEIIKERLRIINSIHNTELSLKIEDVYIDREQTGTRVIIDIPIKIAEYIE